VGYDREGLIMVDMRSDDFFGKYDLLRSELLKTGVVSNMSESMGKLTELVSGNDGFDWRGRNPNKNESFGTLAVTHEHGKRWDGNSLRVVIFQERSLMIHRV
jgi:hypothetical protein